MRVGKSPSPQYSQNATLERESSPFVYVGAYSCLRQGPDVTEKSDKGSERLRVQILEPRYRRKDSRSPVLDDGPNTLLLDEARRIWEGG